MHYTGSFEYGTVFDSSNGEEPLEFTIGDGDVIAGERHEELVFSVGRDQLPPGSEIEVGDMLQAGLGQERTATVQVMEVDNESVTLDANHPLAGKTLVFDLQVVSIG